MAQIRTQKRMDASGNEIIDLRPDEAFPIFNQGPCPGSWSRVSAVSFQKGSGVVKYGVSTQRLQNVVPFWL